MPHHSHFKPLLSALPHSIQTSFFNQLNLLINYSPTIGLMGKTGAGKSSLINALFQSPLSPVSNISGCTRQAQYFSITMSNHTLTFIDLPGVGESIERDKEYHQLYRNLLPELDLIIWVLKRKPATKAKGQVRFYRVAGQNSVTVPKGTIVQTERINGQIYSVVTTETVTIEKESALIAVDASDAGGAFNLAPGYFRILPVAVPGIEQAQNEENWLLVPGADKESDNDLRDRCRNQYNLVGNYHTDAVYQGMIASVVGLSIDRIFFLHDAPRGAGTANAYLLLDSGVISQPFIDKVNDYVNTQGHHGHGDDMQCMPMPETQHAITLTVYVENITNLTANEQTKLKQDIENLVRCAFRENTSYDVKKTWPYSRFSFSNLGREIHRHFTLVDSLQFNQTDIISELSVPRLKSLTVELQDA